MTKKRPSRKATRPLAVPRRLWEEIIARLVLVENDDAKEALERAERDLMAAARAAGRPLLEQAARVDALRARGDLLAIRDLAHILTREGHIVLTEDA